MEQQWYWYLWGFFVILLVEELGMPLPFVTSSTMVALALQGRSAGLPLWSLVLAASAASIVGSTVLYMVGRTWGPLLTRDRRLLRLSGDDLSQLKARVGHNAFWAILSARFLPGLTQAASILAGMLRVPLPVLWSAALIASAGWTIFWLSGGYVGYEFLAPILDALPQQARLPVAVLSLVLLMTALAGIVRGLGRAHKWRYPHKRDWG